jgi:hypothetical protein
MEIRLEPSNVENVYKLGRPGGDRERPVKIAFETRKKRNEVL